ncbi:KilA-N domain-containing protein [Dyella ginsengisoli]|uniref:KilA-N domain-containing protein n=1 Tax=Dyella ginsengisoli TaxID=363848 RepID=UPI00384AEB0F
MRRDQEGRYCLNDLHRAAGGEKRHLPAEFIRLGSTKELAAAVSNYGDSHISPIDLSRGRYGGTYVHEDLAIDYAAWISPVFKLGLLGV